MIDGVLLLILSDNNGIFFVVLMVMSVLASLFEEVVFRGFIFASFTKWLSMFGVVFFSSVLFGFVYFVL